MQQPFFSIVIPTRGRPKFLRDAVVSALRQNFDNFEVLVSDNYNDIQTQALLDEFKKDRRLRCIRTDGLLNMPKHWDFATQHAHGQYVLILTDRSVLKHGALKTIHGAISVSNSPVEVCSWRWSLYDDAAGSEYGDGAMHKDKRTIVYSSRRLAEEFAQGLGGYVYCLPRGLNSCYKNTLMQRIRHEFGSPFKPISPDYYSAFAILGTAQEVLYIDKSLFFFQGNADSNGGRGMTGIDTGYLEALGEYDIYTHVPIKLPLVKSSIFEDFLVAREVIGGNLKDVDCDWSVYFENCYYELLIKKEAGVLSVDEVSKLFTEWERALSTFDQEFQTATRERVAKLTASFIFPVHLQCIKAKTITSPSPVGDRSWTQKLKSVFWGKKNISNSETGKKRQSALEVAGF